MTMSNVSASTFEKDVSDHEALKIHEIHEAFEDMHCKQLLDKVLETLEKDPFFHASEKELTGELPVDELRHLAHLRMKRLLKYNFVTAEMLMEKPLLGAYFPLNLGLLGYGWGVRLRAGLNSDVCIF